MKKLLLMATCIYGALACSKQEEPIKIVSPEVVNNTQDLLDFKKNRLERHIVASMHYDWGTKPGYSLANTPDSLDMIILKNNYVISGNRSKIADLKIVQGKGTWVLPSIDLELKSLTTAKKIAGDYKEAKKAQDKAWAKAGDKPSNPSDVTGTYKRIKDEIVGKENEKLATWLKEQIAFIGESLSALGYNGISIRLPQTEEVFTPQQVEELLAKSLEHTGQGKDKLLVIESPIARYKEQIGMANFVVLHKPEVSDFVDYEAMVREFEGAKLLLAYDLNDSNLTKGYKNNPFFSPSEDWGKDQILLKYKHQAKAGIAVYHAEKMYFVTDTYQGFVNPYVPLKALIHQVTQTSK